MTGLTTAGKKAVSVTQAPAWDAGGSVMVAYRWVRRFLVGIAVVSLFGACTSSAAPSPSLATPTLVVSTPSLASSTTIPLPSPAAVASSSAPAATATGSSPGASGPVATAPAVAKTRDVIYGATGALTEPEQLDVYAPTKPGPWPVIVMFHGAPGGVSKTNYAVQASKVAAQGFVVFVPNWGTLAGGSRGGVPTPAQFDAFASEGTCAVAFARGHATEYGGDPDSLILFGHSAGANLAGAIAFTRPAPTPGCPGGTSLGPIHALVTWDGDWTLTDPSWDTPLAADPSSWNTTTPITHIGTDTTLKVVMLASDVVGAYFRDLSDPTVAEKFFKMRGPSDVLRQQLKAIGALDDKTYDIKEIQQLFYTLLKDQGNPVTLTELQGASHDSFGSLMLNEAMSVFVAAFKEASES